MACLRRWVTMLGGEFRQTQRVLAGGEDGWSCLSRPVVCLRRCGTGKPGSCPGFCLRASLQRRACFFLLLLRLGKSSSTEDAPTTQCRIPQVSTNKLRFIPQRSIALTRGREDGVFGFADDTPRSSSILSSPQLILDPSEIHIIKTQWVPSPEPFSLPGSDARPDDGHTLYRRPVFSPPLPFQSLRWRTVWPHRRSSPAGSRTAGPPGRVGTGRW